MSCEMIRRGNKYAPATYKKKDVSCYMLETVQLIWIKKIQLLRTGSSSMLVPV